MTGGAPARWTLPWSPLPLPRSRCRSACTPCGPTRWWPGHDLGLGGVRRRTLRRLGFQQRLRLGKVLQLCCIHRRIVGSIPMRVCAGTAGTQIRANQTVPRATAGRPVVADPVQAARPGCRSLWACRLACMDMGRASRTALGTRHGCRASGMPPYSVSMTGEVSPLGRGDEVASPGERASHEDRDRVVELLRWPQVTAG